MQTSQSNTTSIEYATPALPKPPSPVLFGAAIAGWAVAALGGLICLAGYALTGNESFALYGFGWIAVGGVITCGAIVCGERYAAKAKACNYLLPHTFRRAAYARRLPMSNFALAAVCAIAGIVLFATTPSYVVLSVKNATGASADVAAISEDGTVSDFGTMTPGGIGSRQLKVVGSGRITLRVREGDVKWEQIAVDRMDSDDVPSIGSQTFLIEVPK